MSPFRNLLQLNRPTIYLILASSLIFSLGKMKCSSLSGLGTCSVPLGPAMLSEHNALNGFRVGMLYWTSIPELMILSATSVILNPLPPLRRFGGISETKIGHTQSSHRDQNNRRMFNTTVSRGNQYEMHKIRLSEVQNNSSS